jgi:HTH-type transcriptional regulator / antitoxin HigA
MTSSFKPNWASPPGDTIGDVLNARGWSMADLAGRLEQPESRVRELIEGRTAITIRTATKLAAVLGATVEFWMSRDALYRQTVSRLQQEARGWLSELPLSDMIRFGWLDPVPRAAEEFEACLSFFGVGTIATWRQTYGTLQEQVAFRTSPTFDSRPGSVIAWLRRGEIEAARITCGAWNKDRFGAALSEARKLTMVKDLSVLARSSDNLQRSRRRSSCHPSSFRLQS